MSLSVYQCGLRTSLTLADTPERPLRPRPNLTGDTEEGSSGPRSSPSPIAHDPFSRLSWLPGGADDAGSAATAVTAASICGLAAASHPGPTLAVGAESSSDGVTRLFANGEAEKTVASGGLMKRRQAAAHGVLSPSFAWELSAEVTSGSVGVSASTRLLTSQGASESREVLEVAESPMHDGAGADIVVVLATTSGKEMSGDKAMACTQAVSAATTCSADAEKSSMAAAAPQAAGDYSEHGVYEETRDVDHSDPPQCSSIHLAGSASDSHRSTASCSSHTAPPAADSAARSASTGARPLARPVPAATSDGMESEADSVGGCPVRPVATEVRALFSRDEASTSTSSFASTRSLPCSSAASAAAAVTTFSPAVVGPLPELAAHSLVSATTTTTTTTTAATTTSMASSIAADVTGVEQTPMKQSLSAGHGDARRLAVALGGVAYTPDSVCQRWTSRPDGGGGEGVGLSPTVAFSAKRLPLESACDSPPLPLPSPLSTFTVQTPTPARARGVAVMGNSADGQAGVADSPPYTYGACRVRARTAGGWGRVEDPQDTPVSRYSGFPSPVKLSPIPTKASQRMVGSVLRGDPRPPRWGAVAALDESFQSVAQLSQSSVDVAAGRRSPHDSHACSSTTSSHSRRTGRAAGLRPPPPLPFAFAVATVSGHTSSPVSPVLAATADVTAGSTSQLLPLGDTTQAPAGGVSMVEHTRPALNDAAQPSDPRDETEGLFESGGRCAVSGTQPRRRGSLSGVGCSTPSDDAPVRIALLPVPGMIGGGRSPGPPLPHAHSPAHHAGEPPATSFDTVAPLAQPVPAAEEEPHAPSRLYRDFLHPRQGLPDGSAAPSHRDPASALTGVLLPSADLSRNSPVVHGRGLRPEGVVGRPSLLLLLSPAVCSPPSTTPSASVSDAGGATRASARRGLRSSKPSAQMSPVSTRTLSECMSSIHSGPRAGSGEPWGRDRVVAMASPQCRPPSEAEQTRSAWLAERAHCIEEVARRGASGGEGGDVGQQPPLPQRDAALSRLHAATGVRRGTDRPATYVVHVPQRRTYPLDSFL